MSTENDRQLGAELESQISALEQSYENLTTLQQAATELDQTNETVLAGKLASHFSKE